MFNVANTVNTVKQKIVTLYSKLLAKHRSKTIYPEALELDLNELLSMRRKIRVAIIDDEEFPWKEALENRGCKVVYFPDYTKPISQVNQKTKVHDLSSYDLIICDIHGIGKAVYPGKEGIGVIEEVRMKNPLHVIAAYTGNPGVIYSKMKKQDTLDMVFSRDWDDNDFLLNFDELIKVFSFPRQRWDFIRRRLAHLGVGNNKIDEIRIAFVEQVIFGQLLKQRFQYSLEKTRELVLSSSQSIDIIGLAKFGINATKIASLISPFVLESN